MVTAAAVLTVAVDLNRLGHIYLLDSDRCVCMFSSNLFWMPSSLDVPAGVTQEEGHTGFLIHFPSAVHAFVSLVDRETEFCVLTIESFSTRWAF